MSEVLSYLGAEKAIVAGLKWDTATKVLSKSDARQSARKAKAKALLLRVRGTNLGLVETGTAVGDDVRLISFAAAVSDVISEPTWCGVFHVDSQAVFIAVIEECISADSDQVMDVASARSRFDEEAPTFSKTFAPAHWGIAGASDSDTVLAQIDWNTAPACDRVVAGQTISPVVLASGFALVAFGGFWVWQHRQAAASDAATQIATAARQATVQLLPAPQTDWKRQPDPQAAAALCMDMRTRLAETAHQGWDIDTIACDLAAKTITASLSPFTDLAVQPQVGGFTTQLGADGKNVLLNGPLTVPATKRDAERPSTQALFAARNFLIGLTPPAQWKDVGHKVAFTVTTGLSPDVLAAGLARYPTSTITRIDLEKEDWRVSGFIYY